MIEDDVFGANDATAMVEATEYTLPDGRRRVVEVPLRRTALAAYKQMRAKVCRLTGELLRTGQVSFAIEHAEGDFDIIVCANDTTAVDAYSDMVERFDPTAFDAWLAEVAGA